MEGSESSRSRSRRDVEDGVDARGSWKDDEEREDVDGRKSWSGKSRKHSYEDEAEELDDSRRRSSADRNESRRKSISSSSRAYSGDDDDYDVRRESRASKVMRRSPEERSERRSSDVYKDREGDSSRRRREDENDRDSSRRSSSRTSGHDVSHSKSRPKTDRPYDVQHERQEKDILNSEGRASIRDKQGHLDQEVRCHHRRMDEAHMTQKTDGTGPDRADTGDGRSSFDQSKHRNAREVRDDKDELCERWEDTDKRKGSDRVEKNDEDKRLVDPRCDTGLYAAKEYKHGRVEERLAGFAVDFVQSDSNHSAKPEDKDENVSHQMEGSHRNNENVETKDKLTYLDEDGHLLLKDGGNKEARHNKKHHGREKDGGDQGLSDSENEMNVSMKEKTREDSHGDYKSYMGRDRNRELEGSNECWRNRQKEDSKEANDYDTGTEWRHGQERFDGGNFHGRSGYRKDSRGRYESGKGPPSYGNRYDSSDSIEIRLNRNLDFGRENSLSGKRTELGPHQDLIPGTNYRNGEDPQEIYYDGTQDRDQNIGKNPTDSQNGRGLKGAMISRGPRGRSNGRDPQRMGVPVPMMPPPPFDLPLGLPPGAMQPLGPNITHSPGPLGPGIFIPPFPGPLVWPGSRGIDVNMLAVPPNLHIPPPVAGTSFSPSAGVGPNHNIHLNQTGIGTGAPMNASGSGFSPIATTSREMMHDKKPTSWTPQRNSGAARKAPSRCEQNDYSQNFVDTGMRPQNFIRELELTCVVEDYPKLRELIQRKDEIVSNSASAPMYYKCDLKEHILSPDFFGTKFDVILVDPPWEEYVHRTPGITDHIEYWTSDEIMNLKIEVIADTPSFIFLWVGDGIGLEQGRQCLKKWGFRRCEDICWIKTNKKNSTSGLRHDSNTLLQHSKEHCLMGIKGTVRRSTDGHIIHANIDTDIIIAEEPTDGSTKKPEDMYRIIEHFVLGRRRLELFGEDHNIRPGWLTLGKGLSSSNFNKVAYIKNFMDRDGNVWQGGSGRNPPPDAPHLVVTTLEIESLRPKSPPAKNQQHQSTPPMGSSSSTNRRPPANTPQNVVTIIGSETMVPAPWASTLDSNPSLDSFGLNALYG